jgi:hypothetical protein
MLQYNYFLNKIHCGGQPAGTIKKAISPLPGLPPFSIAASQFKVAVRHTHM